MLRVIIAVVVVAVLQFAWGFAFHGPLGAMDHMTNRTPDEVAVAAALKTQLPESGTYFVPMCPGPNASEAEQKAHEERASAGPVMQINYHKGGFTMDQMPMFMGASFVQSLLTVLMAAGLLKMALPGLHSYLARVLFVFGLGVFAGFGIHMSDAIWFHHGNMAWPIGKMVFCVGLWLIGGVVMGAIIKPADTATTAAKPRYSMAA